MRVNSAGPIEWPKPPEMVQRPGGAGQGFGAVMQDALGTVNGLGRESARLTDGFLTGESEEIHSVILAQQKAAVAFDLFLQVRNKVVQAYQEVMRMQV